MLDLAVVACTYVPRREGFAKGIGPVPLGVLSLSRETSLLLATASYKNGSTLWLVQPAQSLGAPTSRPNEMIETGGLFESCSSSSRRLYVFSKDCNFRHLCSRITGNQQNMQRNTNPSRTRFQAYAVAGQWREVFLRLTASASRSCIELSAN
jgi:hypothetical protein